MSFTLQSHSNGFVTQRFQIHSVEVLHAQRLGFLDQKLIKIRPVPMRICDLIMRAGGYEQFVVMIGPGNEGFAQSVMIKCKTSFETASDLRITALPRAPFRERQQPMQIVPPGQLFEQQTRERGG